MFIFIDGGGDTENYNSKQYSRSNQEGNKFHHGKGEVIKQLIKWSGRHVSAHNQSVNSFLDKARIEQGLQKCLHKSNIVIERCCI